MKLKIFQLLNVCTIQMKKYVINDYYLLLINLQEISKIATKLQESTIKIKQITDQLDEIDDVERYY